MGTGVGGGTVGSGVGGGVSVGVGVDVQVGEGVLVGDGVAVGDGVYVGDGVTVGVTCSTVAAGVGEDGSSRIAVGSTRFAGAPAPRMPVLSSRTPVSPTAGLQAAITAAAVMNNSAHKTTLRTPCWRVGRRRKCGNDIEHFCP
jgi:type IV secretory pathway TrbL component